MFFVHMYIYIVQIKKNRIKKKMLFWIIGVKQWSRKPAWMIMTKILLHRMRSVSWVVYEPASKVLVLLVTVRLGLVSLLHLRVFTGIPPPCHCCRETDTGCLQSVSNVLWSSADRYSVLGTVNILQNLDTSWRSVPSPARPAPRRSLSHCSGWCSPSHPAAAPPADDASAWAAMLPPWDFHELGGVAGVRRRKNTPAQSLKEGKARSPVPKSSLMFTDIDIMVAKKPTTYMKELNLVHGNGARVWLQGETLDRLTVNSFKLK